MLPPPVVPPVVAAGAARGGCGRAGDRAGRETRNREQRRGRVRGREGRVFADRVGLDLEVEVDADQFEEGVVDRDEPHFDRDLKVLEPAELPQQVGDLLVDLSGMLDDQADAEEERHDRTGLPLLVDAAACVAAEAAAHAVGGRHLVPVAVLDVPGARARSTS